MHKFNKESAERVVDLAGCGVPQDDIAHELGITAKTLRKHYRRELNRAAIIANVAVAKSLFAQAVGGNVTAAIFWLKTRAGWREKADLVHGGDADHPVAVATMKPSEFEAIARRLLAEV